MALCVGLASAIACSEIAEPPPPTITNVEVRVAGPLLRTLSIQLDRPGSVSVAYGNGSGTQLQVVSLAELAEHQVLLARLRADSRYAFEVSTAADEFANEFLTDSLPGDLAAIQFTAMGVSSQPLTLLEFTRLNKPDAFSGVVIVDSDGKVVW